MCIGSSAALIQDLKIFLEGERVLLAALLQKPLASIGRKIHRRLDNDPRIDEVNQYLVAAEALMAAMQAEKVAAGKAVGRRGNAPALEDMTKPDLMALAITYGGEANIKWTQPKMVLKVRAMQDVFENCWDGGLILLRKELEDVFGFEAPADWSEEALRNEFARRLARANGDRDAKAALEPAQPVIVEPKVEAPPVEAGPDVTAHNSRPLSDVVLDPARGKYRAYYEGGATRWLTDEEGLAARRHLRLDDSRPARRPTHGGPTQPIINGPILAPLPEDA